MDRIVDSHGREGLILKIEGEFYLVAFVVCRQLTRPEMSYYPSQADIAAMTADLRKNWTPEIEVKKNQYPNAAASIPTIESIEDGGGRRKGKRSTSS